VQTDLGIPAWLPLTDAEQLLGCVVATGSFTDVTSSFDSDVQARPYQRCNDSQLLRSILTPAATSTLTPAATWNKTRTRSDLEFVLDPYPGPIPWTRTLTLTLMPNPVPYAGIQGRSRRLLRVIVVGGRRPGLQQGRVRCCAPPPHPLPDLPASDPHCMEPGKFTNFSQDFCSKPMAYSVQ
jgi:hypothetical protein